MKGVFEFGLQLPAFVESNNAEELALSLHVDFGRQSPIEGLGHLLSVATVEVGVQFEAALILHVLLDVALVTRPGTVLRAAEISGEVDVLQAVVGDSEHILEATSFVRRNVVVLLVRQVTFDGGLYWHDWAVARRIDELLEQVDVLCDLLGDLSRRYVVGLLLRLPDLVQCLL